MAFSQDEGKDPWKYAASLATETETPPSSHGSRSQSTSLEGNFDSKLSVGSIDNVVICVCGIPADYCWTCQPSESEPTLADGSEMTMDQKACVSSNLLFDSQGIQTELLNTLTTKREVSPKDERPPGLWLRSMIAPKRAEPSCPGTTS